MLDLIEISIDSDMTKWRVLNVAQISSVEMLNSFEMDHLAKNQTGIAVVMRNGDRHVAYVNDPDLFFIKIGKITDLSGV